MPYLEGPLRAAFDAWLEATRGRYLPPLTFSEVRKGVQALSSLYVERRSGGRIAARAAAGEGKRAAFATYYAPLHFLMAHRALAGRAAEAFSRVRVVHDLGCGTGAAGVAAATLLSSPPTFHGIDLSSWALDEAMLTAHAFGLKARTRRAALPEALPRAGAEDLLVLGFVVNELDSDPRERLLRGIETGLTRGARLLVLEPLALSAAPWWPAWAERLARRGVEERTLRCALELPAFVHEMDRACGLDHRELRARVLLGPLGTGA
ncbi:MAG TPA: hypothetical protein DEP35_14190 [Deltaproteobacteria bacterium]|jgi:SAM-dependent methyltransferase|nr:hypothetical protein [Deltaproteobacteria bacterium]